MRARAPHLSALLMSALVLSGCDPVLMGYYTPVDRGAFETAAPKTVNDLISALKSFGDKYHLTCADYSGDDGTGISFVFRCSGDAIGTRHPGVYSVYTESGIPKIKIDFGIWTGCDRLHDAKAAVEQFTGPLRADVEDCVD